MDFEPTDLYEEDDTERDFCGKCGARLDPDGQCPADPGSDVAECDDCLSFLNDDDECPNPDCKYSPFYDGQGD